MRFGIVVTFGAFALLFSAQAYSDGPACETALLPAKSIADLDQSRAETIHKLLFPNLPADRIKINEGIGRVEVMPEVDFSYYVQTSEADSAGGEMTLIPMATSRLTPGYMSTPDWWTAHQSEIAAAKAAGQPVPFQDRAEVAAWMKKNGLSTNPDVYKIRGTTVQRIPLQKFLLDQITAHSESGDVTLYRGAERATELSQWKSGIHPKGARYWTPDATYAWRYARKDPNFIPKLISGDTPLIKFKIPKADLRNLVQRGDLVLGTELTKNAHRAFDLGGVFKDHLVGTDFMGDGAIGVEIEIRGTRIGANAFTRYFQGAATIEDLADQRVTSIEDGTARLKAEQPWRAVALDSTAKNRIAKVKGEEAVLLAIRNKAPAEEVSKLFASLPPGPAELVNVDGVSLNQVVREYKP